MKKKLIEELHKFKTDLTAIDAQYETITEEGFEHKKHLDTLRSIEKIVVDIRNRVDRFYTQGFQYNRELKDLSAYLRAFGNFFGEIPLGGLSMEDCKLRVIGILEGMIDELVKYDVPSDNDPQFDQ